MSNISIKIFGTRWCGDCSRTRRFFDRNDISYQWVDIDSDERGEEFVFSTNKGMRSVPTILFEDGSILVEPTDAELQKKLRTVLSSG
jgi:glutaredoxin-like protein